MEERLKKAFNDKLRSSGESFSVMMCTSDPAHLALLERVLLACTAPSHWFEYISYLWQQGMQKRRFMMIRLLKKALEHISADEYKDNAQYVALHLMLAELHTEPEEHVSCIESAHRRGVGRRSAALFLQWASAASDCTPDDPSAAKEILHRGIESNAEPRHELISALGELSSKPSVAQAQPTCEQPLREDNEWPCDVHSTTEPAPRHRRVNLDSLGALGKLQGARSSVALSTVAEESTSSASAATASARSERRSSRVGAASRVPQQAEQERPEEEDRATDDGEETLSFSLDELIGRSDHPQPGSRSTSGSSDSHPSRRALSVVEEGNESATSSAFSSTSGTSDRRAPRRQSTDTVVLRAARKGEEADGCNKENAHDLSACETVKLPPHEVERHKAQGMASRAEPLCSATKKAVDSEVEIRADVSSQSASRHHSYLDVNIAELKSSFGHFLSDRHRIVSVNGNRYLRLNLLGKGGSTSVYRVMSKEGELYAFKKIEIKGADEDRDELCRSYSNEIDLLTTLKGTPYIIALIDSDVDWQNHVVSMVLEAGEIDLAKVLQQRKSGGGFEGQSPFFTRTVWHDMLKAVDCIHQHRIVHSDLKPANFVFVKGTLKLIDFGIANAISNDTTSIYRDNQVGTINYMSPEAIAPIYSSDTSAVSEDDSNLKRGKMKLGRPSDVWSLGIILYQLIYGSPPFSKLSIVQKLAAIPNPNYIIEYPADEDACAVHSIQCCLHRDPLKRAPISGSNGLLSMPFLEASKDYHGRGTKRR